MNLHLLKTIDKSYIFHSTPVMILPVPDEKSGQAVIPPIDFEICIDSTQSPFPNPHSPFPFEI